MTGLFLTDRSDSFPGGRRRPAFTLVEMIVVMAIIGVLAAILIPTLRAAMVRAKVTAIAADLANLDAALNQFKEKYGSYPPDFSNANVLTRHVQKAWPRITENERRKFLAIAYHRGSGISGSQWEIDPAEALVFWLGGFSEDPQHPFTGPGGPFPEFGGPLRPLERNQDNAFFPFDGDRLTESNTIRPFEVTYTNVLGALLPYKFIARESWDDDIFHGLDNDPFPVCLTRGTNLPIAYLDAHNYLNSGYPIYANSRIAGHARAYLSDRKLLNVNAGFEWINPHSYQLITAGLDEDFGVDVFDNNNKRMFKRYATGTYYVLGDLDNITNFSGGTLEDAIP